LKNIKIFVTKSSKPAFEEPLTLLSAKWRIGHTFDLELRLWTEPYK